MSIDSRRYWGQSDPAPVRVSPGDEGRGGRRHAVDEFREARVAITGVLVEGVLAHHVGGRQQEERRRVVALVGLPTLVG